ncbi:unnamed protein product [Arctia plantaginis]|uniref:Uncharacterized protein n=1 Tax=Arctia plantaginis TaxID=874455 RepID=A0A8S0YST6_ARCPL|nr:unnamed protein product [Arctia plantaginis]CAB3232282.1 unnamed protein product [Arctia plantaginis]
MFSKKHNSFLMETLLPDDKGTLDGNDSHKRVFDSELTNNLSSVSALYIYTGTPSHGYGSQAPKVAETVKRSLEYNRKVNTPRTITIGDVEVERLQWEKRDGPFVHDKFHANYITSVLRQMSQSVLVSHHTQMDSVVRRVMDKLLNQSSDILTQGRQTFCPFREQSVTAAQAYKTAFDFLSDNTRRDCFSLLDWIQAIIECFEKDRIRLIQCESCETEIRILDPETK